MDLPDRHALLSELEDAARAEVAARQQLRRVSARVAVVTRQLIGLGASSVKIAARVARAIGLPLDIRSKRRLAARLRKRASRVTSGHGNEAVGAGAVGEVPAPCSDTEATKENAMPKPHLIEEVTTTVTKRFITEPDEDEFDDEDLEDDDESEEKPQSKKKRAEKQ